MSIFPRISFCDDPPEIDISRSGKPPRPRPCPPQWPRASPPGAAAAAPAAPAARQMTRRRANKARLAAARQAGRVSSGGAPFATCVPSKWMGCSTRISGAMAICGTRHGRSTKAQSRTRSSVRCTGPGTPISHTDDGQVVQDIGKRRDRLDAHAWASSQLVELVFDESDIADASSDKKHPPQGWTIPTRRDGSGCTPRRTGCTCCPPSPLSPGATGSSRRAPRSSRGWTTRGR